MNTRPTLSAIQVMVVLGLLASGPLACAAKDDGASSAPTNAEIEGFQRQIPALQEQLHKLGSAQGTPSQQRLMQRNWQSMLDYMQEMQSRPWMMHRPDEMGSGKMGRGMMGRGMMGRGDHGDWMMGCPMVGGPAGGWQLPPDVDAEQYRSQMRQNMQLMHDQMAKIWSTSDPADRQRLLQEHWQDMYRNMQTMRGMDWMWSGQMPDGQAATPLSEPNSPGAKLVSQYCTQCHAEPSPRLHTASEWEAVTSRMEVNMKNLREANRRGVKVPSDAEMKSIVEHMKKFAR